jgi:hypothetical protein
MSVRYSEDSKKSFLPLTSVSSWNIAWTQITRKQGIFGYVPCRGSENKRTSQETELAESWMENAVWQGGPDHQVTKYTGLFLRHSQFPACKFPAHAMRLLWIGQCQWQRERAVSRHPDCMRPADALFPQWRMGLTKETVCSPGWELAYILEVFSLKICR